MPVLSTFGAACAIGTRPAYWDTNIQFFAIGGGGSGAYNALTTAPSSSDPLATNTYEGGTWSTQSAGYPGRVASNTQFVPMAAGQSLRYRDNSGTTATNGSGLSLKIKSGETYSVIVGAGGSAGSAGGSTKLMKSGTQLVLAEGGAAAAAPTYHDGNFQPSVYYAQNNSYSPNKTYVYHKGVIGFQPPSSNANNSATYTTTIINSFGGWDYPAINWFGASYSNLLAGAPTIKFDDVAAGELDIPILPSSNGSGHFGGVSYAISQTRPYWDNTWYGVHWGHFAFGYQAYPYNYQDGRIISPTNLVRYGTFGAGGGYGAPGFVDSANAGNNWYMNNGAGDGAFVLAYPASLPPLSSTTGLATSTGMNLAYNPLAKANMTSNPQIVNKNGVDYRVYLWASSGSFTV